MISVELSRKKRVAPRVSLFAYFKQALQPIPVKTNYSVGKEVPWRTICIGIPSKHRFFQFAVISGLVK